MPFYTTALSEVVDGTIDLFNDTLKVMLLQDTYTPDKDHDTVSEVVSHELSVSGYTGGFGGAGRKTATVSNSANKTDDRFDIGFANQTHTALAAGENIGYPVLIKEITNDAASRVIFYWTPTVKATNGQDVTLQFTIASSGGNIRILTGS